MARQREVAIGSSVEVGAVAVIGDLAALRGLWRAARRDTRTPLLGADRRLFIDGALTEPAILTMFAAKSPRSASPFPRDGRRRAADHALGSAIDRERLTMKFLVTYRERRGESDPSAAVRRAARSLNERAMPPGLTVHQMLSRIGGGGGYAVVETDDAEDLQHVAALFSAYQCRIEPVADVPFNGQTAAREAAQPAGRLPEMPASEPREGAFSDDDVYDTED